MYLHFKIRSHIKYHLCRQKKLIIHVRYPPFTHFLKKTIKTKHQEISRKGDIKLEMPEKDGQWGESNLFKAVPLLFHNKFQTHFFRK